MMKKQILLTAFFLPFFLLAQNPGFAPGYPEKGWLTLEKELCVFTTYDAQVLPNGKILLAGTVTREIEKEYGWYTDENYLLLQLSPEGRPDSSFGTYGMKQVDKFGAEERLTNITYDQHGAIYALAQNDNVHAVFKFKPTGELDSTFGDNGYAEFPDKIESKSYRGYHDILALSNGKVLVGGNPFFVQLLPDGSIDPAFDSQPVVSQIGQGISEHDYVFHLASQSDSMILVAGRMDNRVFVIRKPIDSNNSDPGFGQNGMIWIGTENQQSKPNHMHSFDDGSFILAGRWGHSSSRKNYLAHYNKDGQADASRFGQSLILPNFDYDMEMSDMIINSQGEVYFLGKNASNYTVMSKLKANGVVDSNFGVSGQFAFDNQVPRIPTDRFILTSFGHFLATGRYGAKKGVFNIQEISTEAKIATILLTNGYQHVEIKASGGSVKKVISYTHDEHLGLVRFTRYDPNQRDYIFNTRFVRLDSAYQKIEEYSPLSPHDPAEINDLIMDDEGRIYFTGIFIDGPRRGKPFLGKLDDNLQLDPTFGVGGLSIYRDPFPGVNLTVTEGYHIHLLDDGNILVANGSFSDKTVVLRFLPDGKIDESYDQNGYLLFMDSVFMGRPLGFLPLANGNIVLNGFHQRYTTSFDIPGINAIWLSSTGELINNQIDRSFAKSKHTYLNSGKMIPLASGKVLQWAAFEDSLVFIQYLLDGKRDPDFGNEGVKPIRLEFKPDISNLFITRAMNGDFYVVMNHLSSAGDNFVIALLDSTFSVRKLLDQNEIYTFHFGEIENIIEFTQLASNGDLLLAGNAQGNPFITRLEIKANDEEDDDDNEEDDKALGFLYPNPVEGTAKLFLVLESEEKVQVRLLDLQGRMLLSLWEGELGEGNHKLDLTFPARINSGHYFLEVITGSARSVKKIVIKD